jgi:hypothetical protein
MGDVGKTVGGHEEMRLIKSWSKKIAEMLVMVIMSVVLTLGIVTAYMQQLIGATRQNTATTTALTWREVWDGVRQLPQTLDVSRRSSVPSSATPTTESSPSAGMPEGGDIPAMAPSTEGDPLFSEAQISAMRSQLTPADQEQMVQLLLGRIPMDQALRFSQSFEGGLTWTELTDLSQALTKVLTPAEYERVIRILLKVVPRAE